jgi:hypothetical protein
MKTNEQTKAEQRIIDLCTKITKCEMLPEKQLVYVRNWILHDIVHGCPISEVEHSAFRLLIASLGLPKSYLK